MRKIKFSVGLPNGDYSKMVSAAKRADELGYFAISLEDHFFRRGAGAQPSDPQLECYTTLSAIAASTNTVRIAPLVTGFSYRNPALLAKMIATIDNISGGRFIAGLGAGWFKEEYDAYHYTYPSNVERMEQLADGIKVLKAMWSQEEPTYHGRYFSVDKAYCFPRPVQKPHPPIMIGGGGKRILKIAGEEADIVNVFPPILRGVVDVQAVLKFDESEISRRLHLVRESAQSVGRETDSIEFSQLCYGLLVPDESSAESAFAAFCNAFSVPEGARSQARSAPQLLLGTADYLRQEISRRIETLGITHFFLNFMDGDSLERFAEQVMPSFVA